MPDEFEYLPRALTDPFRKGLLVYNVYLDGAQTGQVFASDHDDARRVAIAEFANLKKRILNGATLTVRAR